MQSALKLQVRIDMPKNGASSHNGDISDFAAIDRALAGDQSAYEELYKKHRGRVFGSCLRLTRNQADAEDITQETFQKAFLKLGAFRKDAALQSWLYKIARNIFLESRRRKKPYLIPIDELLYQKTDEGLVIANVDTSGSRLWHEVKCDIGRDDPVVRSIGERMLVKEILGKLSPEQRETILMNFFEDYEHSEIGERTNCPVSTSKIRYHRALIRLLVEIAGLYDIKINTTRKTTLPGMRKVLRPLLAHRLFVNRQAV